jgi:hypothetical protein
VRHRLFAASLFDLCDECLQCMATGAPADNPALPQNKFKLELAESLIEKMHEVQSNGEVQARGRAAPPEAAESSTTRLPPAFQGHRPEVPEKRLVYVVCKQHQSGLVCECGAHICSPSTKGRTCYLVHLSEAMKGEPTATHKRQRRTV